MISDILLTEMFHSLTRQNIKFQKVKCISSNSLFYYVRQEVCFIINWNILLSNIMHVSFLLVTFSFCPNNYIRTSIIPILQIREVKEAWRN